MAYYYVELAYRFAKRKTGVRTGMTIRAFSPDEAEEIVRDKLLKGFPARRFAWSKIREATPNDMKLGVVNEGKQK